MRTLPAVTRAIESTMKRMPEELQHPFEDFLIFARELDASDLDAIVADFVALVKQFKVKVPKQLAELREKGKTRIRETGNDLQISGSNFGAADDFDFDFPGDILKSVDALSILKELGNKIPAPFDVPFGKALQIAELAPLLPILEHVKSGDVQSALAEVMSSAAVLKVMSKFDPEMPRNILKKVLQNAGFTAAVQKMLSKLPANMQSPLKALQSLSQDLEGDMDEMMEKLQGVMMECKEAFAQHKDIKFPQDLIKSVDPISILAMIGEKIPPPLSTAYSKALELAAFAPLLPIVEKLKSKDLEGALAVVMSSAAVLKVTSKFDPEMPRKILKKVLQNTGFQSALQQMASKLPANLQSPLQMLQSLSQNLEGGLEEIMGQFEEVMKECKRVFAQRPDIKFPQDLIKSVDPTSILAMIGEKIPPPLSTAYSKALELATFAPLLAIVEKLKSKDMEGAVSAFFCSGSLLRLLGTVHKGLPFRIVNGVLQDIGFQSALQQTIERVPAFAQSPLTILQAR